MIYSFHSFKETNRNQPLVYGALRGVDVGGLLKSDIERTDADTDMVHAMNVISLHPVLHIIRATLNWPY